MEKLIKAKRSVGLKEDEEWYDEPIRTAGKDEGDEWREEFGDDDYEIIDPDELSDEEWVDALSDDEDDIPDKDEEVTEEELVEELYELQDALDVPDATFVGALETVLSKERESDVEELDVMDSEDLEHLEREPGEEDEI